MRICAAQLEPIVGDLERNVSQHMHLIDLAVSHRADLIFFPELSLTGYEPALAKDLATDTGDRRLDVFQTLTDAKNIIIGVGLPTHSAAGIRISMILFQPDKQRLTYSKQLLHADELPFFVPGQEQLMLSTHGRTLAPAICYESLQSSHAETAASAGADIYLASVAKPARNVEKAYPHYSSIAKRHSMTVLMANSVGPCDNFMSVGQSALWNSRGELVAKLDRESGIIMIDTATAEVSVTLASI